jgi:hypothetical protein
MRASNCGNVWSMALSVTLPLKFGSISICSLASRARAKSSSCTRTLFTTTL